MDKPNYYAVIPSNVRYDDDLSANAKLLYGEITSLCNEKGYCWATNEYFANLYNVSKISISRWISQLSNKGYIGIKLDYKAGTREIENRYIIIDQKLLEKTITPINKNDNTYYQNCIYPINKNVSTPINKNVKENNTSNTNNKNEYKEIYKERFEMFWKQYPKKVNKFKSEEWFRKNKPNEILFNYIIKKLEMFKKSKQWEKENGKYIPHPTTWLNQKRWEDELNDSNEETAEERIKRLQKEIEEENNDII